MSSMVSPKGIQDLPTELLQQTLSYLDERTLQSASSVSKTWNQASKEVAFLRFSHIAKFVLSKFNTPALQEEFSKLQNPDASAMRQFIKKTLNSLTLEQINALQRESPSCEHFSTLKTLILSAKLRFIRAPSEMDRIKELSSAGHFNRAHELIGLLKDPFSKKRALEELSYQMRSKAVDLQRQERVNEALDLLFQIPCKYILDGYMSDVYLSIRNILNNHRAYKISGSKEALELKLYHQMRNDAQDLLRQGDVHGAHRLWIRSK